MITVLEMLKLQETISEVKIEFHETPYTDVTKVQSTYVMSGIKLN